ncbi:DUF6404 family protein [Vibrio chagasii]|nr:DUF6404 family protein [Vibrio chagasii]
MFLFGLFRSYIWWGFEWFLDWNEVGISMLEAAYKSLQCGALLFGLLMSIFYAIRRKQLNLTDWDSWVNDRKPINRFRV